METPEPNPALAVANDALFAVRVLTHQGHNDTADDELIPHLREIAARYSELKRTNGFMESALIAKSEWLTRFLSANVRVSDGANRK